MICSTATTVVSSATHKCRWTQPILSPHSVYVAARLNCATLSLRPLALSGQRELVKAWAFGRSRKTQLEEEEEETVEEEEQQRVQEEEQVEETVEVEEELPWIQDKALDAVEFTGSVTQWIPGPRVGVGQTSLPWLLLALLLSYPAVTFALALYRTINKFNSPLHKRRQLNRKNAALNRSIDDLFQRGRDHVNHAALLDLMKKHGFAMEEVLRKYIRYSLNERPFNAELVIDLIQLRKASMLTDAQVAGILNDISRRIVNDKGPVAMDASGYSEKGFKRKLAVQALFGKIFYLSELPEFCSRDGSLIVKEVFGVTDEDADKLRIHTVSEAGDMETVEMMVDSGSDSD